MEGIDMTNKFSGYRLTTYHGTPFLGTHFSVDKFENAEWSVVKLFTDLQDATEYLNKAIDKVK